MMGMAADTVLEVPFAPRTAFSYLHSKARCSGRSRCSDEDKWQNLQFMKNTNFGYFESQV